MPRPIRLPPREPTILFTGFEPSGDDHASAVVRELRERHPGLRIFAWGGPKMAAAGATVVERTGKDAVMGIPGVGKIIEHLRINERIRRWLIDNPVTLHVPVDSPAANFPICKITRESGARVMHLVAPQVWAWGSWRVNKLRRLTDHVCCLLPFEEDWFRARGVPATFVGHPVFDHAMDVEALDSRIASGGFVAGELKLAMMPGSRPVEMRKHFPVMVAAFRELRSELPGLVGMVAATNPEAEARLRELAARAGGWPDGLGMVHGSTDAAVRWADACLVCSGTVTLQVARQQRPMVIVYRSSRWFYWGFAHWMLATPHLTLPNLVAGERIVPELMPFFGDRQELVHEVMGLIDRPDLMARQREALGRVTAKFAGFHAARSACDQIERLLGLPGGGMTGSQRPQPAGATII